MRSITTLEARLEPGTLVGLTSLIRISAIWLGTECWKLFEYIYFSDGLRILWNAQGTYLANRYGSFLLYKLSGLSGLVTFVVSYLAGQTFVSPHCTLTKTYVR